MLDRALTHIERVLPYDGALICLVENGIAQGMRQRGFSEYAAESTVAAFSVAIDDVPNLKTISDTHLPENIRDTQEYDGWIQVPGHEWIRSNLGAPIIIEGALAGFLSVYSKSPGSFSDDDAKKLMAFANQAAVAIENARLYHSLQQRVAEFEILWQTGVNLTAWLEDIEGCV